MLRSLCAAAKYGHGGRCADPEPLRDLWRGFDVDRRHFDAPSVLLGDPSHDGSERLTGWAPRRPEVDEDGPVGLKNLRFEVRIVDGDDILARYHLRSSRRIGVRRVRAYTR